MLDQELPRTDFRHLDRGGSAPAVPASTAGLFLAVATADRGHREGTDQSRRSASEHTPLL